MLHRPLILGGYVCRRQDGVFPRVSAALILSLFVGISGCAPKTLVEPPVEAPLSRSVLGYGVVAASYARLMNEPDLGGVALGIVREKTVMTVLERRVVREGEAPEYWVLVEEAFRGWLPESAIKIYDTEGKAKTAASQ